MWVIKRSGQDARGVRKKRDGLLRLSFGVRHTRGRKRHLITAKIVLFYLAIEVIWIVRVFHLGVLGISCRVHYALGSFLTRQCRFSKGIHCSECPQRGHVFEVSMHSGRSILIFC